MENFDLKLFINKETLRDSQLRCDLRANGNFLKNLSSNRLRQILIS